MLPAEAFFAQLSSAGASSWTIVASYPIVDLGEACVNSGAFIYCVGGADSQSAFYSHISSSGLSPWTNTTEFPKDASGETCVSNGGYIYCIGWGTDQFYYAHLSSSGISSWNATTRYPIGIQGASCVSSNDYIYCVGGETKPYYVPTSAVYYAPLSSSGIGTWMSSDEFPFLLSHQSCVTSDGYIYCIGGDSGPYFITPVLNAVYYAALSPEGVSNWTAAEQFPISLADQTCVVSGGYIYCVVIPSPDYTLPSPVYYVRTPQPQTSTGSSVTVNSSSETPTSPPASSPSGTSTTTPVTASSATTSSPPSSSSLPPSYVALVIGVAITLIAVAVVAKRERRNGRAGRGLDSNRSL
ncbi:MAG: hypothetical protein OK449_03910 [Thaumarchaeota archaeon]|nr:hypothetical protein [Nitrososphaerota archaeon]